MASRNVAGFIVQKKGRLKRTLKEPDRGEKRVARPKEGWTKKFEGKPSRPGRNGREMRVWKKRKSSCHFWTMSRWSIMGRWCAHGARCLRRFFNFPPLATGKDYQTLFSSLPFCSVTVTPGKGSCANTQGQNTQFLLPFATRRTMAKGFWRSLSPDEEVIWRILIVSSPTIGASDCRGGK